MPAPIDADESARQDREVDEIVGRGPSGAFAYTVGQRKGLRLTRPAPDGQPRYVVEVRPDRNQVVVGTADLLGINAITGDHARWCGPAPDGLIRVGAQVRAHGEEFAATARAHGGRDERHRDAASRRLCREFRPHIELAEDKQGRPEGAERPGNLTGSIDREAIGDVGADTGSKRFG